MGLTSTVHQRSHPFFFYKKNNFIERYQNLVDKYSVFGLALNILGSDVVSHFNYML